jgi:cell division protein FtsB
MAGTESTPRHLRREPSQFWPHVMLFIACVLLVNGLFGERGLTETIRARRGYTVSVRELNDLKRDNARLREQARRLRTDPGTIEGVARAQLGLIRQGEILVTVHDAK